MPKDGVYWSSSITKGWFWWNWTATIYRGNTEIQNHGSGLTRKVAESQRDTWLTKMGEVP